MTVNELVRVGVEIVQDQVDVAITSGLCHEHKTQRQMLDSESSLTSARVDRHKRLQSEKSAAGSKVLAAKR